MDGDAVCAYRGVVSHNRWSPVRHGFAYEIFMLSVDVDRLHDAFREWYWWPLAAVNRTALVTLRESDHMKLSRKPGQSLGDAVRDVVHAATGARPTGRIQLLTHPAYFGYCFNPVSFFYVWAPDGRTVETVVAEVSNTPWNEMHNYVLDGRAPGVVATTSYGSADADAAGAGAAATTTAAAPAPADASSASTADRPQAAPTSPTRSRTRSGSGSRSGGDAGGTARRRGQPACAVGAPSTAGTIAPPPPPPPPPRRVCVEDAAAAAALWGAGAVPPTDYAALLRVFTGSDEGAAPPAAARGESTAAVVAHAAAAAASVAPAPRLRFRWAKAFHVSPFMPMAQTYDWVFTPPGRTLLVQSLNRDAAPGGDGRAMLSTQLRLTRVPLAGAPGALAYLALVAMPLLTWRVQVAIHVEALWLWAKGVGSYAHPTTAATVAREALFTPVVLLAAAAAAAWEWAVRAAGGSGVHGAVATSQRP